MDNEAASRGTTVYLVDKRIDMLPSLLGTNLCSLRPFVERLAFSAIWVSCGLIFFGGIDGMDWRAGGLGTYA